MSHHFKGVRCIVVILSALQLCIGSAGLRIDVVPKSFQNVLHDQLNITCTPEGLSYGAKDVLILQILKEGEKPIAVVNKQEAVFGPRSENYMEVEGHIDRDASHSYLKLTINNPKLKDAGTYQCLMYFMDEEYQINEQKVSVNVTIDNLDMATMTEYLLKKVSNLETTVYNLENTIVKQGHEIQDQKNRLKNQEDFISKQAKETSTTITNLQEMVANLNKVLLQQNSTNSCALKWEEHERIIVGHEIAINNHEKNIEDQGKQLKDIDERGNFSSAFMAGYDDRDKIHAGDPLLFSYPIMNVGNDYNRTTGLFTAARKGLYVFHLTVMTYYTNSITYVDLVANGRTLERLYAMDKNYNDQSSVSVVVSLDPGDEVKPVVWGTDRNRVLSSPYSGFSGYLVKLLP